ncbi:hypothetical protein Syun_027261 [Stephania yunnanensis]|uniref:F-box/LRR-repeat protein 15/At3g58940/PEG3-like LRR domain-containing protein n=1 Tax=Stephania yunnanensis TaxID=152371 RepID=A0AAP0EFC1_9MAGN
MANAIKHNLHEIDIYFEHGIRNLELPGDDIFDGLIRVVRLKSYGWSHIQVPNSSDAMKVLEGLQRVERLWLKDRDHDERRRRRRKIKQSTRTNSPPHLLRSPHERSPPIDMSPLQEMAILWATVPYLHFDIHEQSGFPPLPDYNHHGTSPVDHVIYGRRQRTASSLIRLRLRYHCICNAHFLKSWMANAVQQNLQEIDIFFRKGYFKLELPDETFGDSIRVVRLKCHRLPYYLPDAMLSAPNLRTLEVDNLVLPFPGNEDSRREIVISCPLLETLVLKDCRYDSLDVIKLSTYGLKKLEIVTTKYAFRDECTFEINTPNLSSFVYQAVNISLDCDFGVFAGLVKASVLFEDSFLLEMLVDATEDLNLLLLEWIKDLDAMKILEGLQRVESLCLKKIQCFERFPNTLGDLLASYGKLKKLELSMLLGNACSIIWLTTLLRSCPLLESFVLKLFKTFDSEELEDKVEPVESVMPLPYTLSHLKYVTIETGVEELNDEFEFLQSLLNNAPNLERMTVTRCAVNQERVPEFRDKLMALFQQFPNVQVSLQFY